jgi:hypothetical protein
MSRVEAVICSESGIPVVVDGCCTRGDEAL